MLYKHIEIYKVLIRCKFKIKVNVLIIKASFPLISIKGNTLVKDNIILINQ